MSGHSKWSSIKHKKGAADAKRGKLFTKLIKEIIVAAREDGGDADANPRLRLAISSAKSANMPNSNIEKAIKRGTGEIEGVNYVNYTYEGYGHNGVAILIDALTDNKQRTVAEIRYTFSKYGGNLAETGSVAWLFEQKGLIQIPKADIDEEEVMMAALDAGADDVITEDEFYEIYTPYSELHTVLQNLESAGYIIENAELTRVPKNTVTADNVAAKLFRLIDQLEDLDDVQKIYSNLEVSDETIKRLSED